ncbi:tRNA (5-methylaminomethyl-2-thiouridine)(34)-methyltransferase MnmD [Nostoc sp. CENA67]|uniref:tRNA (5-methylaminomethyl-2-thiouridine)(34)-methyltransferase MnmD n=1 Tax=Amazonocrinis nigriterrae CENA67 TaxID=2794033 RepID=A0A8J7HRS6_9NOST|nr:MnmC family methyltransferase [Amazonocrinis nigriterrae]MBH8561249.1 tRNA (5-methylaminomethyl-2-thiouridine)(34)-methyltransferase MnmD [Amazonocrinis nigriterrae CENA67]
MSDLNNFQPQLTADGSFTFFSQEFSESFHSHFGAKQESYFKFVAPTQLAQVAQKPVLRLLDICYGLGYNTAAALETIWAINPNCHVELIALELNPSVPQAAIAHNLFDNWNYQYIAILSQLAFKQQFQTDHLNAKLLIGDARTSIQLVHQLGFQADAIFLDPFSPPQCPQLWTVEFIKLVSQCLHPDGILATYSCAAAVRTALLLAGLIIGSTPPVGRRSPGTVAAYRGDGEIGRGINKSMFFLPSPLAPSSPDRLLPLSQEENEHLLTRAAIPYRDPQLNDPAHVIVMRRRQEQETSSLEPTSRWRKRWLSVNQDNKYMETDSNTNFPKESDRSKPANPNEI